jgi:hypothetical protein
MRQVAYPAHEPRASRRRARRRSTFRASRFAYPSGFSRLNRASYSGAGRTQPDSGVPSTTSPHSEHATRTGCRGPPHLAAERANTAARFAAKYSRDRTRSHPRQMPLYPDGCDASRAIPSSANNPPQRRHVFEPRCADDDRGRAVTSVLVGALTR